jgi:hypothetical protein
LMVWAACQPANIQSCIPGFSVMHSSTHSFFYSFIHVHTSLPISSHEFQASQSCIHPHIHSSTHYSTNSFTCTPTCQYPVMHSRLLSHAFILLLIILLIHSRAHQPANIQSCTPGFSVMHSSTHSFFYPLFYSFIHVHTSLSISSQAFQASHHALIYHIHSSAHSFNY